MLPILLDLKFVKIYTFGVFLVLALFWGSYLLWKNFLLTSYKEEEIFDGFFWSLAGGLVAGRLVYVILNFNKFHFDILKFILINGYPGLSLYGFLVGAFVSLGIYFLAKKRPFLETMDYFIPGLFLALGIGKIGSFFSSWTPLYEGLYFLLGAYLATRILFAIRRQSYAKGFNFYFFCWYFSLGYFFFSQTIKNRLVLSRLNFNGLVSFVLLLTFTFYFLYYFRGLVFSKGAVFKNIFTKKHDKKTHKGLNKKMADKVRKG